MNPFKPNMGQMIQSNAKGIAVDQAFLAHTKISGVNAAAANTSGILTALNGAAHLGITTGITSPAAPRNITATAGGTATDIKAIQVTITGTNFNDEVISETLPPFTVDTAGTVEGSKAFKTVTMVDIPAHDGTGATTSVGWGEKLGIPFLLPHNTVRDTYLNNVKETTAPTVMTSTTAIESNTVDLNSALNGTPVDIYLMV